MAESEIVPCVPCQSTGEAFPAVKYCINCNESLCKTCLEFHLKFGATKSHKLVDCSTQDTRQFQGAKQLSTYMACPDHEDKVVELLCNEHDALCCLTCASTAHRICRNVSEIKKLAAEFKTSGLIDKTRARIEEAGNCMQEMIDANVACRNDFEKSENRVQRKLEEIKIKMLKIFERMESAVLERVKNLRMDEDITMGDREEKWKLKMNANAELLEVLDAITEVGTESQVFVALHKMKRALLEAEDMLSDQGNHVIGQRLNLKLKDKLESFLQTDVIDNLVVVEPVQSQYQLPKTVIFSKHGFDVEDAVSASDSIDDRIEGAIDVTGVSYLSQKEIVKKETLKIEPQYFTIVGGECKIIHETGIILYDTSSPSIPVAQFIACNPMTKERNNFSVRVLKTGKQCCIAIGVVPKNYPPNSQPGWFAQSIGYHADDGGIYLEYGRPTRITKTAKAGDIMSFYVDMDKNIGFFRKNGVQCIELDLNPSQLGYYPCVGMHSVGEAVQIIEKEFWQPQGTPDSSLEPPAFPTYKYGNLWISPGQNVTMTKLQSDYNGWLTLHNPSKGPVGFKVIYGKKTEQKVYGVLEYKKDWLEHLQMNKVDLRDNILIEWLPLEAGRKYTPGDMALIFGVGEEVIHESSHQHKLAVVLIESTSMV